jgi:hypothetical protein
MSRLEADAQGHRRLARARCRAGSSPRDRPSHPLRSPARRQFGKGRPRPSGTYRLDLCGWRRPPGRDGTRWGGYQRHRAWQPAPVDSSPYCDLVPNGAHRQFAVVSREGLRTVDGGQLMQGLTRAGSHGSRAEDRLATARLTTADSAGDSPPFSFDNGVSIVRFTPPGSPASIQFGTKLTSASPGSAENLHLIVSDIESAREQLVARGPEASGVFHPGSPRRAGRDLLSLGRRPLARSAYQPGI